VATFLDIVEYYSI